MASGPGEPMSAGGPTCMRLPCNCAMYHCWGLTTSEHFDRWTSLFTDLYVLPNMFSKPIFCSPFQHHSVSATSVQLAYTSLLKWLSHVWTLGHHCLPMDPCQWVAGHYDLTRSIHLISLHQMPTPIFWPTSMHMLHNLRSFLSLNLFTIQWPNTMFALLNPGITS